MASLDFLQELPLFQLLNYLTISTKSVPKPGDPPTAVGAAADLSTGLFDETWIQDEEIEIAACCRQMMRRLVTTHQAVRPVDCTEYYQYRALLKLFEQVKCGVRDRISLVMRLVQNYNEDCLCVLMLLNHHLAEQINDYWRQLEALKRAMQMEVRQENPEAHAFLNELREHSEAVNRDAQDEMLARMARIIAQEIGVPEEAAREIIKQHFYKEACKKGGDPGKGGKRQ